MRFFTTLACLPFLLVAPISRAAEVKSQSPGVDERVAWLKGHVAPLRSIDPADEDYSDLEPIRRAIGDARIVQLSEQSHGDGATFHARTRLIKFLHQKCGFDVLAFESGLYDCRKAWEALRAGKVPAREAVSLGVFDIWTSSTQVQPMIDYLGRQARGPRPLEICGFDCQFTGPASSRFLPGDVAALMNKLPADSLNAGQRAAVVRGMKRLADPGTGIDPEQTEALAALRKALSSARPSDSLPAAELVFWRQFLESAAVLAEAQPALQKRPERSEKSFGNLRDPQMARNLVWLAREVYPQRKILVWAAAFHLLRNHKEIAMVVEPGKTAAERKTVFPYPQIATMGDNAYKELGKETYSLFFTAAEGEFQTIRMPRPVRLKPLVPGSLEDLLVRAGCTNAFLDLRGRGPDGGWLGERLLARFLGNADHEAAWTKICDGVLFTRTMYPSTHAGAPEPAAGSPEEKYYPRNQAAVPGTPFDRYTTRDELGRTVTFYVSQAPKGSKEKLPLALIIPGSGCSSVFTERDGKVYGGLQNLLLPAGKGRLRVLVVEKPGVRFGDSPAHPGTAEDGSPEFRREHTLPRWVEANHAALEASRQLPGLEWTRTLVVGHSEGGIVAAHLAAADPFATHVAVLAGNGPTQLFDLIDQARRRQQADEDPAAAEERVRQIGEGWAKVLADPDNPDALWLGHPYRRWSSFLKTSTQDGLLASRAALFLAQGTEDRAVSVAGFDLLRAELAVRGREATAERLEGYDHGFRRADDPPGGIKGFQELLGRVAEWFGKTTSPFERDVKKDLERLQGTWDVVALTQGGETKALEGQLKDLQIVIAGDTRTVRAGELVYSEATFRIDPTARPATMDVHVTQGPLRGKTLRAVYEIDGDGQRFCQNNTGGPRPQEFTSKPGSAYGLLILKRRP